MVLLPRKLAPSHGKSSRLVYFYIVCFVNDIYILNIVTGNWSYRLKFLEEEVGHQPLLTRTKVLGR